MTLSNLVTTHGTPHAMHVPAVSAATLVNGVLETGNLGGSTPATLFQAASISKAVAAATALALVDNGLLDLDAGVNDKLGRWRIPGTADWADRITLRLLLRHGGALSMRGYAGYPSGAVIPTLDDILDGRPPANSAPVRCMGLPGLVHNYSGGGYTVLQRLIEDNSGPNFAAVVDRLVFGPAGMTTATFTAPNPAAPIGTVAKGHARGGVLPGDGWRTHPELAAAGMWCTPTDLVRFAAALQASVAGGAGSLFSTAIAREMMTAVVPGWGLGVELHGTAGLNQWFSHGGSDEGYRCDLSATVATGQAVAVMTNGELGGRVIRDLAPAARAAMGWPDVTAHAQMAAEAAPPPIDPEAVATLYSGTYDTPDGTAIVLTGAGRRFSLQVAGQRAIPVDALSPIEARVPGLAISLTFTLGPHGPLTMTIHQFGGTVVATKR